MTFALTSLIFTTVNVTFNIVNVCGTSEYVEKIPTYENSVLWRFDHLAIKAKKLSD